MSSASRVVTPQGAREIAALARLRLREEDLALWSEQLSRIVEYIDQLKQIPEEAYAEAASGPATPLRDDTPFPGHGEEALEANAPRRIHGYGVVPRVVGSGS